MLPKWTHFLIRKEFVAAPMNATLLRLSCCKTSAAAVVTMMMTMTMKMALTVLAATLAVEGIEFAVEAAADTAGMEAVEVEAAVAAAALLVTAAAIVAAIVQAALAAIILLAVAPAAVTLQVATTLAMRRQAARSRH